MTENNIPKVSVSKKHYISVVWLIPLIALGIAAALYLRIQSEQGELVRVLFKNGEGLVANHTPLKYHGIEIGTVKALDISKDFGYVIAEIQLNKNAEAAAREGAEYWIVRSEIGLNRIKHLGALVSGPYIEVRPGNGKRQFSFEGQGEPDSIDLIAETPGRDVLLSTSTLGSLEKGDKVYYRDVNVGYIKSFELSKDSRNVIVKAHIELPYMSLIRTNSKFWNTGGFDLNIGLTGIKMKTGAIDSLIGGGVAFATPDNPGALAPEGYRFTLNQKAKNEWLEWQPRIWRVSKLKKKENLELFPVK